MNHLLPSPSKKIPIAALQTFFENLRRYSQVKVHQRTGVNDIGWSSPPLSLTSKSANVTQTITSFPGFALTTGGKFSTCINDIGGKLPPVSTTPAVNCHQYKKSPFKASPSPKTIGHGQYQI
jgi:hypothetical protein